MPDLYFFFFDGYQLFCPWVHVYGRQFQRNAVSETEEDFSADFYPDRRDFGP